MAPQWIKVLCVEDDRDDCIEACRIFVPLGVELEFARDRDSALDRIRSNDRFDGVVLDLFLANGDRGVDMGREIRGIYPKMPILFWSSHVSDREELEELTPFVTDKHRPDAAVARFIQSMTGG